MNKDETLRLALEAMKINNKAWKLLADSGDAGNWEAEEQGYYQLNEQAINAIKEALETKDEPVAWGMKKDGVILDVICPAEHEREEGEYTIPLYTTPSQRTWVGLTDEEFEQLLVDAKFTRSDLLMIGACVEDICNMVEAKLKEKNT